MNLSNGMMPEPENSGRSGRSPHSGSLFTLLLVAMSFTISSYLITSPSNTFNLLKNLQVPAVSEGAVLAETSFHPLPANPRNDIGGKITKKVLVLEYNPLINGGVKLSVAKGWGDPAALLADFIAEMRVVSQGVVDYQIYNHTVLDAIPRKADGFQYTTQGYLNCLNNPANCHQPDLVDYNAILAYRDSNNRDVCALLNQGIINELWLWGGPYFGYKENVIAGTDAFYIEGLKISTSSCNKPLHIFGFNYERGVTQMTDTMGHRFEYTMKYVNNELWQTGYSAPTQPTQPLTPFDKFTARGYDIGVTTGCGNSHGHLNTPTYPGYGYSYSWDLPDSKQSTCEDWLKYPNMTGQTTALSCSSWGSCAGSADQERNWRRYWFYHVPKYSGTSGGKWNNWWWYVLDYKQALANVAPPAPDFIIPHACNDVCLRPDQCQAIDSAYTCSTDALWNPPTPLGNWPGTGNVLVFSESIYGGKLTQKIIRGESIYTRTIPVVNNTPNWSMASSWSNTALSNWPGSGAIQGLSEAVYGGKLTQKFMRGSDIHVRLVPLVNGVPSWGSAGAWTTTPQSNWPGSGDIQGFSETVYANKLNQTLVRGTDVYSRTIPLVNNAPSWGSASAWTSTPLSAWPGTGVVDSYNETTYINSGVLSLVQKIIRSGNIYVRNIPIQNSTPIMTAGRCRLASNPTSTTCTQ